jgi:hypothetical protein
MTPVLCFLSNLKFQISNQALRRLSDSIRTELAGVFGRRWVAGVLKINDDTRRRMRLAGKSQ